MNSLLVNNIIRESVNYIAKQQQADGGFISYSSKEKETFVNAISYRTNFITALIIEALCHIDESTLLEQIKQKGVTYLFSQKSEQWSWNYWSKFSKEFLQMPYPDDLDDTFCALNAISLYDKKLLTGSAYAHILELLTSVEKKEGGPYKTWHVDTKNKKNWNDVDIVVNSNIAYFLSMQEIALPNLQLFFSKRLQKKDLQSQYYPNFYPLLYFLSRFILDKKSIIEILLESKNKKGYWENPLNTSLAVLTLLNSNYSPYKLEKDIDYLMSTYKDFHWQADAFCIDPTRNEKKYYAGSSVLTTAFCLFAISLFQKRLLKTKVSQNNNETMKNKYLKKILNNSLLTFTDKEFATLGNVLIGKLIANDITKQISLMPYYFYQSLEKGKGKVEENKIVLLGVANVLGWLAYTIYDDFFDDEGSPQFLSLANMCLRRLTWIFDTAFRENENITNFYHTILDGIDEANFWEVTNCRLPLMKNDFKLLKSKLPGFKNLNQLANKSLGHGIGPMTILLLLGYKKDTKEFISLYNFFKHYLIAKQLNDDTHDWEQDLKKGHITFVVSLILKKALERNIINKNIFFKNDMPKLQKLFWYEIIEEISKYINEHVREAEEELAASSLIINKRILEDLLTIYKEAANEALEESNKTKDFLKVYKK
jgi:hypothetical protein